jgi:hypothetical protein
LDVSLIERNPTPPVFYTIVPITTIVTHRKRA